MIAGLEAPYHWSLDQTEYATDVVSGDLQALYDNLSRTALQAVKPEHVATFWGKKRHENHEDELGNRFDLRLQGTETKHASRTGELEDV